MAVQLKRDLERRIETQVAAGAYESADELVSEALDLLDSHKEAVRAEIQLRRGQIARGEVQAVDRDRFWDEFSKRKQIALNAPR